MKAYIQTKVNNQLTLDARKQRTTTEVELHIINKHNPDSWFMTFNDTIFDSIAVKTYDIDFAKLIVTIKSPDEDLHFVESKSCDARQAFAGLLFISGNHTMKEFNALSSEITKKGQLSVVVNPSIFWTPEKAKEKACLKVDGNKIGFRFVVGDQQNNCYYSNDPIFSGPDWDRL